MQSRKRKREREVESSPRLTSEDITELVRKIEDSEITKAASEFWAKRNLSLDQARNNSTKRKKLKELKKIKHIEKQNHPVSVNGILYSELLKIKDHTGETIRSMTQQALESFVFKYHAK